MIIAILMGRKGSKGFPGKNLHKVLGKPLAYYPMRAALDCPEIKKTFISTDDERLMELAQQNNIEIIKRPPELCTDEALGEHVFVHTYKVIKDMLTVQDPNTINLNNLKQNRRMFYANP